MPEVSDNTKHVGSRLNRHAVRELQSQNSRSQNCVFVRIQVLLSFDLFPMTNLSKFQRSRVIGEMKGGEDEGSDHQGDGSDQVLHHQDHPEGQQSGVR